MTSRRLTFGEYFKEAFKNRWNLLFLGGATAAAIISGRPDVTLPIVGAIELGALVWAANNPRFQRAIFAQRGAVEASRSTEAMMARYDQLYRALDPKSQEAFDKLRGRCEALRLLAERSAASKNLGLDQITQEQLAGLNRLLWVYLKLLHTRSTLDHFFASTDQRELERQLEVAKNRLANLPATSTDDIELKKRRSVEDTVSTIQTRLTNLSRAKDNYEFVNLELERVAAKLEAVAELAINRQDPASVTDQVDDAARSVEATEQALSELQVITGITSEDLHAPAILSSQRVR
ncbi:MAG: hypothetical protein ACK4N5_16245 [Myxococcales bacterium]